ncbi:MAG: hypothetical protein ABIK79_06070 [Chloroflexota bacterium]
MTGITIRVGELVAGTREGVAATVGGRGLEVGEGVGGGEGLLAGIGVCEAAGEGIIVGVFVGSKAGVPGETVASATQTMGISVSTVEQDKRMLPTTKQRSKHTTRMVVVRAFVGDTSQGFGTRKHLIGHIFSVAMVALPAIGVKRTHQAMARICTLTILCASATIQGRRIPM